MRGRLEVDSETQIERAKWLVRRLKEANVKYKNGRVRLSGETTCHR